jgi:glycosyltransferase involved in cell wall biosynthesis
MIILSDCLTEKIDEGCLKVANSLTRRIQEYDSSTIVVSYDRKPRQSDIHLKLNKLFLNKSLISLIRKNKQSVLYIPFASNTKASALRTLFLSLYTGRKVDVLFVLRFSMSVSTKYILKLSGARIIALSEEAYKFYDSQIGKAVYLKTGINTKQFIPVNAEKKQELRKKYAVEDGKRVLLHVGHLKNGRNIDKLLNVSEKYHVFLVVSSVTESEKDEELRKKLNNRPYTTIIDSYLEHIEEVYQMADVYLFPVQQCENCIDVPLSVLEAASCNIPIVTTNYGELKAFNKEKGFRFISQFDNNSLNSALDEMSSMKNINNRESVLEYDWDNSVERLMSDFHAGV